jgi:hypothetical protein
VAVPPLKFYNSGYRHVFDAIEYLAAAGETELTNPYKMRTLRYRWIWEGFSSEDLLHNLSGVLTTARREYRSFVEGNNLKGLKTTILGEEQSIIYLTGASVWDTTNGYPYLHRCVVSNMNRALPSVLLVDSVDGLGADRRSVTVDGRRYEIIHYTAEGCEYLFQKLPLQRYIHRLVIEGINSVYGQKLREPS